MNKREIILGVFSGLVANLFGIILIALILFKDFDIIKVINRSIYENNLTKLISLGAFMNLLVFFIFLKFDYLERAKGVIISTLCVAILTIYLNNF